MTPQCDPSFAERLDWLVDWLYPPRCRACSGPSRAATANTSVPPVGRIFSLFRIRSVRFVAGHFQIRVEMIMSAEFVFRAIHTLAGPIPGPAIHEKKRQSIRSGK